MFFWEEELGEEGREGQGEEVRSVRGAWGSVFDGTGGVLVISVMWGHGDGIVLGEGLVI